mmetsp:Transcript_105655/g.264544  ORF Transcript_105655/g.264544 Transcript_105655/m.264544 type:complete len:269 (-) Transcript_105655:23-829(-)
MLATNHASTTEFKVTDEKFEWKKTKASQEASDDKEEAVIQLLHDACKEGKLDIVRSLLEESHVNPNSRDRKGWTAVIRAAKSNSLGVLEYLIDMKADLEAQTKEGNSALHKAAKRGRTEAAHMLIKSGSDLNSKNKGGATPLMICAMHRGADHIMRELLQAKADVNEKKDVGYTALMIAARCGNGRAVTELIQAKADLEARDKQHETALIKAKKHHKDEVAQLLVMSGAHAHHNQQLQKPQGSGSNDNHGSQRVSFSHNTGGMRKSRK